MRRLIAGPVEANRGQTVRFRARLSRGQDYAYLQVFSSCGGGEPSPHVPAFKMQVSKKGQPVMANPTTIRLTRLMKPKNVLELTADENCRFYLYQEVDTAEDRLAKGRITRNGRWNWSVVASAFRWVR